MDLLDAIMYAIISSQKGGVHYLKPKMPSEKLSVSPNWPAATVAQRGKYVEPQKRFAQTTARGA